MEKTEIEQERLMATEFKSGRSLPDLLMSIKLKYVKLGRHDCYSWSPTTIFLFAIILPLTGAILVQFTGMKLDIDLFSELWSSLTVQHEVTLARLVGLGILCFILGIYVMANRSRPVYLVDFSCYKPEDELKVSLDSFMKKTEESRAFSEEMVSFQRRVSSRAGLGDETYVPRSITSVPPKLYMSEARAEAEAVMFGALDSLFEKTGVDPADIKILIVNCSLFNPTPSLSSMIVNHYKMREDIKSYNLGGMGCSAGLISIELAKNLLQANPNSYACVVSTENITLNWYRGNDHSMLVSNCLFRMGGAAILLSNQKQDRKKSKYELAHVVRSHKGADDKFYNCAIQKEDENGTIGVSLAKELPVVAGETLKINITTLGPLVLPFSEQFKFFIILVKRKIFKHKKVKPYVPDFKKAFEHFCIHCGGRAVLDKVQKDLDLKDWQMEPSRMTLHRFGNLSSSSVWYEMAYTEAKGRVKAGDRLWQIAFGSGFKCNSAVWRALRTVSPREMKGNAWAGSTDNYPVKVVQ